MTEPLSATVGETFDVSLEGMPTTGFVWEVEIPPEARGLIEPLGSGWTPARSSDAQASPVAGAPAIQRFQFRALAPGEITLTFRYRRSWETTDAVRRTVMVRIGEGKHSEGG
jgi:predicted secreted protein